MTCNRCSKNEATMHFTTVIDGQTNEEHLCAECFGQISMQGFDIEKLLASFIQSSLAPQAEQEPGPQCAGCGMTFAQLKVGGMLGCAQCYQTFVQQLAPLLRRIQGRAQHVGKAPVRHAQASAPHAIERLQEEMREAVAVEQFEKAAQLRDKIRELEAAQHGIAGE